MIRLSDEILNKYIDGELDQLTLNEIKEQLKNSELDRNRLAVLQRIDGELRKLKIYEAPQDFTEKLMVKLRKNAATLKKDKIFIFSISTILMIISLGVIGLVFAIAVSKAGSGPAPTNYMDNYIYYFSGILETIRSFLSAKNISIIGSIFSFGIIITGYIFFENLRQAKRRLSKLH